MSGIYTVAATALGCKVNTYDTQAILSAFADEGFAIKDFNGMADIYIVSTCTVTQASDKKSRQLIHRARKNNPNGIVVVCGCYARVYTDEVKKLDGVDIVTGAQHAGEIFDLVKGYIESNHITPSGSDSVSALPGGAAGLDTRCRAYLKIQDGCENYCSYCVIPYARGKCVSRPPDDILAEAGELSEKYREIVLAGIHIASYGKDLVNADLSGLLAQIHALPGIERIRLSSIEPTIVTGTFLEALSALPKICSHFHLSLQSGCDKTLAAMNRKYDTARYAKAVSDIRAIMPDAAFTTDVIVGFPGETDEDFDASLSFIERVGLAKLHVFKYSPKKNTPAAGFPNQISAGIKEERSRRMIALGEAMSTAFAGRFTGRTLPVLFEQSSNGTCTGHTANYMAVTVCSDENLTNKIKNVKITGTGETNSHGEISVFGGL